MIRTKQRFLLELSGRGNEGEERMKRSDRERSEQTKQSEGEKGRNITSASAICCMLSDFQLYLEVKYEDVEGAEVYYCIGKLDVIKDILLSSDELIEDFREFLEH